VQFCGSIIVLTAGRFADAVSDTPASLHGSHWGVCVCACRGVAVCRGAAACLAASLLCAFAVGRLVPAVFRHAVRPALWPHFGGSDGWVVIFAEKVQKKMCTHICIYKLILLLIL
jgi:hypothetical protein